MTPSDVDYYVEILAASNPRMGEYAAGDANVWRGKHDATVALMGAKYSRETIDEMVGALCESRLDEARQKRKAMGGA